MRGGLDDMGPDAGQQTSDRYTSRRSTWVAALHEANLTDLLFMARITCNNEGVLWEQCSKSLIN